MDGVGIGEVDSLVVQLVVADLEACQSLPDDGFVEDVCGDAVDYLPILLLCQSCLYSRELVNVEDGFCSLSERLRRREALLNIDMSRLLGEAFQKL